MHLDTPSCAVSPTTVHPLDRVRRIALIGAGTMGRAIASGLVDSHAVTPERVVLADRVRATAADAARLLGAYAAEDNGDACDGADVVILCVKPADVRNVLAGLAAARALDHGPLLVSIAAGLTISTIEETLASQVPVVRAMPNTPCRIGRGMTVVARGTHAADAHVALACAIFSRLGRCLVLDERHMDAVTAVSGSGPAFAFLLIEALSDGAVACGLPRRVAVELVAQTVCGAAEMVLGSTAHPAALRDDVTTPGGCTIAGLLALEDAGVRAGLARAVQAAALAAGRLR